ncbi:DUF6471 domain-containing protein [Chitiniphilus purpureus]|uniref:DUF6471 domain-containing protein n=1 Tax=Chitiniphilus purpureus TaxID=2981137 RepID=A0ABY6DRI7_9NEIS|nr:DUF6471 domain-containing protein [Chitiniphilus sp. CD1]UXY16637.1 DUF6471 domain-containing protein [Chitiniphilus sp. CD1]
MEEPQESVSNEKKQRQIAKEWEQHAKRILKAELVLSGMTYPVLAKKLAAMGVTDSPAAIANRISRGKFSFAFFLQCMAAMEVAEIRLKENRLSGPWSSLG